MTSVQDIIIKTLELLQQDNVIEKNLTLRELYNKYLHPSILPQNDDRMWDALANNEVISCFQFDSAVGAQAAKKIKPRNLTEMTDANSLMRLMASEKGAESPLDKYVRYKNNISLWYEEMDREDLTKQEQKTLEPYFLQSYGVPPTQEQMMMLLQDPNICGFTLGEANKARKVVAKKQMNEIPNLHNKVLAQAKSDKLGKYVWKYSISLQLGYAFSRIHALPYSFVGLQTLYLATHFNPIYWNTACLIVNSGMLEDNSEEEIVGIYESEGDDLANGVTFTDLPDRKSKIRKTASTDYSKIAKAIGDIRSAGISVSLVNINKSEFSFLPDAANNQILFGFKGMLNVGDDLIKTIIANRPYDSLYDFMVRVNPNKQAMIALIKGGAFDCFMDRYKAMVTYIWLTCDKKKRLTLQNLPGLIRYGLLPEDTEEQILARRVYEFNRYLKSNCKSPLDSSIYVLDDRALNFINEIDLTHLLTTDGVVYYLNVKVWDKEYQNYMDIFRDIIAKHKEELLDILNTKIFKDDWDKYAKKSISAWEMEVLCFYYHRHELADINSSKYGLVNFFNLSEESEVEKYYTRKGAQFPIYKIYRICGTCIAKNKTKSTIYLLTLNGVVPIKFSKEQFALYDRQVSQKINGTKKVLEKSWFNRGNMLIVSGYRREDEFVAKTYKNTVGHSLYHIDEIYDNGEVALRHERMQGEMEDGED